MRHLNGASEESQCKAVLSKCPPGVGRICRLTLSNDNHIVHFGFITMFIVAASQ